MRRTRLLILLLLPGLLCCSGCSSSGSIWVNYRALEQLQLIQTIGIDTAEEGVRLSVSSGKPMGEGDEPLRMSTRAASMYLAISRLQMLAERAELSYSHTRFVLVGEEKAAQSVEPVLDFMERSAQMRLSAPLFVVRGGTAQQAVMDTGDDEVDVTQTLSALVTDITRQGVSHAFTTAEVAQSLASGGSALVCAVRCATPEEQSDIRQTLLPDGYAVLRGGALAGFLTEEEAVGANMLLNLCGNCDLCLSLPDCGAVTLALNQSSSDVTPVWNADGTLRRVELSVTLRTALTELAEPAPVTDADFLAALEQALADTVCAQVTAALARAQALEADFLGLGALLGLKSPNRWAAVEDDWAALFPQTELRVTVTGAVERTFDLQDPVPVAGDAA